MKSDRPSVLPFLYLWLKISAIVCLCLVQVKAKTSCIFLFSSAVPAEELETLKPLRTAFHDYTEFEAEWITVNTSEKALQLLERLKKAKFSDADRVFLFFIGPIDFQRDTSDFYWRFGADSRENLSYTSLKNQWRNIPCDHVFTAFITTIYPGEAPEPVFTLSQPDTSVSYRQLFWKGYFPEKAKEWSKNAFLGSGSFMWNFSYQNCTKRLFQITDAVALLESNGYLVGHVPETFIKKMLVYIETRDKPQPYGTVTDPRDGTVYPTLVLGCEVWLAENMHWAGAGKANPVATGSHYDYGRLYTWKEAGAACAGLGPEWQLPSSQHWEALPQFLGNSARALTDIPGGLQIKPGGWRTPGGYFDHADELGAYWTVFSAVGYIIHLPTGRMRPAIIDKGYGFSCRCVKKLVKP